MIKSIRHKGLRKFFETGSRAGVQAKHAEKLRLQLTLLHAAENVSDMDRPGFRLHPSEGSLKGRWAIWVSGNWRLTFEFRNGDAFVVDYEGYH